MKKVVLGLTILCIVSVSLFAQTEPTNKPVPYRVGKWLPSDQAVLEKSREMGISIAEYLKNNDSYHFLQTVGALFKTGPTNTNVCDVQLLIVK